MRLYIIVITSIFFICESCNNNGYKSTNDGKNFNDTIILDIPQKFRSNTFSKRVHEDFCKNLNIGSLKTGYDSLQIRVWIECGYDSSNLIVFKKNPSGWKGDIYYYKIIHDGQSNFRLSNVTSFNKTPASGWNIFINDLMKTGLMELPDFTIYMPKYNLPNDANKVLVETATKKRYRLYEYPELRLNYDNIEGAKKLDSALCLIEKEFNFTRPCQNKKRLN
jgi:hypothetical protein